MDVWSVREKLCLSSAVSRNGDQNWVAVSRAMKPFLETNRPHDWSSAKNCSMQYSSMIEKQASLEGVTDLHAKRGCNEGVLKRLTQERIEQLKRLIKKEREDYIQIRHHVEMIKSRKWEHRLPEIAKEIEEEKRKEEEEAQAHQKWLKEREERMLLIQQLKLPTVVSPQKMVPPEDKHIPEVMAQAQEVKTEMNAPISATILSSLLGPATFPQTANVSGQKNTNQVAPTITSLLSSSRAIPTTPSNMTSFISNVLTRTTPETTPTKSESSSSASPTLSRLLELPPTRIAEIPPRPEASTPVANTDLQTDFVDINEIYPAGSENENGDNVDLSVLDSQGEEIMLSAAEFAERITADSNADDPVAAMVDGILREEDEQLVATEIKIEKPEAKKDKEVEKVSTDVKTDMELKEVSTDARNDSEFEKLATEVMKDKELEVSTEVKNELEKRSKESEDLTAATASVIMIKLEKEEPQTTADEEQKESVSETKPQVEEPQEEKKELPVTEPEISVKTEETTTATTTITTSTAAATITTTTSTTTTTTTTPTTTAATVSSTAASTTPSTNMTCTKATPEKQDTIKLEDLSESESKADSPRGLGYESEESTTPLRASGRRSGSFLCTPPIDSLPNSPASVSMSGDESERDHKAWKKNIMFAWREIAMHKYASKFLKPITDAEAPGYSQVIHRRMDLQIIKKNVENGVIRTTTEFERDLMLMFQNAIMYNSSMHDVHHMARTMQSEAIHIIKEFRKTQALVENPQSMRRETRESTHKKGEYTEEKKRSHKKRKTDK